eukprot:Nk52_evm13s358 gene=Nk52_evmTU13s358
MQNQRENPERIRQYSEMLDTTVSTIDGVPIEQLIVATDVEDVSDVSFSASEREEDGEETGDEAVDAADGRGNENSGDNNRREYSGRRGGNGGGNNERDGGNDGRDSDDFGGLKATNPVLIRALEHMFENYMGKINNIRGGGGNCANNANHFVEVVEETKENSALMRKIYEGFSRALAPAGENGTAPKKKRSSKTKKIAYQFQSQDVVGFIREWYVGTKNANNVVFSLPIAERDDVKHDRPYTRRKNVINVIDLMVDMYRHPDPGCDINVKRERMAKIVDQSILKKKGTPLLYYTAADGKKKEVQTFQLRPADSTEKLSKNQLYSFAEGLDLNNKDYFLL